MKRDKETPGQFSIRRALYNTRNIYTHDTEYIMHVGRWEA